MHRFRPSPSMVVALLALVAALAPAAYAAVTITGRNVKDGSLTGRDVKDGSLGRRDVAAGAGVKVRYLAKTFQQAPGTLAGGETVCPKGYVAVSGGVAGLSPTPGAQTVNTALALDGNDHDKIPDRFAGYVHNASDKAQNFEVDAVCARAGSASSNFVQTRAAAAASLRSLRQVPARRAARNTPRSAVPARTGGARSNLTVRTER